jgi:hypothetical protein
MNAFRKMTDEQLVADLRDHGLVGPISARFLSGYRQDREFMELAKTVEAIPGGPEKFKRALVRVGIIPPTDQGDETLLAAWERVKTAERELIASGADATEERDAPAWASWNAANDVVFMAPATTIEGAIVKLRRSILLSATANWATEAIVNDDDDTLFARAEEFEGAEQLTIEALAALMLVSSKRGCAVIASQREQ